MNRAEFSQVVGAALGAALKAAAELEAAGLAAAATTMGESAAALATEILPLAPDPTEAERNEASAWYAAQVLSSNQGEKAWIGRSLARAAYATTAAEVEKIVDEAIEAKLAGIDW